MAVPPRHIIRHVEPGIVTGEARVGGDIRENRKDEFVWKLENCRNRTKYIRIQHKERTDTRGRTGTGLGRRRSTRPFPTEVTAGKPSK